MRASPFRPLIAARLRSGLLPAVLVFLWVVIACRPAPVSEPSTASDEWIRTYTIDAGGHVTISNRNGSIDLEGTSRDVVEVRAERVATASSGDAARQLLSSIEIAEEVRGDRVVIRTEGVSGILIGAEFEVRYHVAVPESASVEVRTSNGSITVRGIGGSVVMATAGGTIEATGLSGAVEARSVNGRTRIEMASVVDEPIDVRSTNGRTDLILPGHATATLDATVVNGRVVVAGLDFEPLGEQTRRRTRGRINGGGAPLEITTVNGSVRVSTPAEAEDPNPQP